MTDLPGPVTGELEVQLLMSMSTSYLLGKGPNLATYIETLGFVMDDLKHLHSKGNKTDE